MERSNPDKGNFMTEKDRRLIDKLLRMSMSNSPNEAAVAAEKLAEVLARNGITREEAEQMGDTHRFVMYRTKWESAPQWHNFLTTNLGVISGVFMASCPGGYLLSGAARDLENFIYILEFISAEVDRMSERYRKSLPKPRHKTEKARRAAVRKRLDDYRHGIVMGVCSNLRRSVASFFASPSSGKDLVPVDERFSSAKDRLHGKFDVTHKEINIPVESKHLDNGIGDGLGVQIRKGIGGNA